MYTIRFFHSRIFILTGIIATFFSCQNADSKIDKKIDTLIINSNFERIKIRDSIPALTESDTLEQKIIDAGLVNIQTLDSTILVDLKYASEDNFMGQNVYGSLHNAYLQPEVAKSLVEAQQYLKSLDSGLTLLIYDAVRPRSVQQFMWDFLDMPVSQKIKFVSNPKNGSIHNYGSAVDLTIAQSDGTPLDMGAKYDEIEKIAYPRLESQFLASGDLTENQINNRKLLRKVMNKAGFTGISTEWWHFNRYSRSKAKRLFKIIE